jgi:hypothetical protein
MKQQVDEIASWQKGKLTKRQVDKKQFDKTASWKNSQLMKQPVDETAS